MGPEEFEPPPTGLKGRHAAATPRPRAGHLASGHSFDPDHRASPRHNCCQTIRAAGFKPAVSSPPSLRISQAFPHPGSDQIAPNRSTQRELNPHLRRGGAVGSHSIMGTINGPSRSSRAGHRVGLEPTSPHYGCGILAAGRPVRSLDWDRRGSNPHRTG